MSKEKTKEIIDKAIAYAKKCEVEHGDSHPKTLDANEYVKQLKELYK